MPSKADVLRALREAAAASDKPLEARALGTELWRAARHYFGSTEKAREAAGIPGPARFLRWTPDLVLEEIRKVWRSGVAITELELLKAGRKDLLGAMTSYFGGIVKARELARVPGPEKVFRRRQRWDEGRVAREIVARQRAGEPLAESRTPNALVKAGRRYYGSWQAAIEAAGFNYDEVRLQRAPYTRSELLEMMRVLAAEKPELTLSEFYQHTWYPAVVRLFGSIEKAAARAHLTGWPLRLREKALPAREVVTALRRRSDAGKSITWQAVQTEEFHLWYSGMQHFGDWKRAVEAAGLDDESPQGRWNREKLLDALRARVKRGASMRPADISREERKVYFNMRSYFGSYLNALREIGYEPPWALKRWTPEIVVAELRCAAGGRGWVSVREAGGGVVNAAQKRFGSFTAACKAAGLETGGPAPMAAVRARYPRRAVHAL